MEKLTKKEIRKRDAFVAKMTQLGKYLEERSSIVLSTVVGLFIIGALWAGYGFYKENQEQKAQTALFLAQSVLQETQDNFDKASKPTPPAKDKKADKQVAKPAGKKPTGNLQEDYKEALIKLRDVVDSYPRTQTSVLASLDIAGLHYSHKDYDTAISLLEKASHTARHPVPKAIVLNKLASAYDAKGNCQKAIETWQNIEANSRMSFMKGRALISSGLCYEKLNKLDDAEKSYRKAEALETDIESKRTAKKFLRILKWKRNT